MKYRWFYIEGTRVVSVGPLSLKKAREYEEERALDGRLVTVSGLDMLRKEIQHVVRLPENRKQLEREWK